MSHNLTEFFQNMSLLYAEDEIVAQALYHEYFKKYFNTIYLAENGQKALNIYKEKKPDIVILDISMPILGGLDVCKIIRKNDKYTKIILLTALTDKDILLEAIELGLTTYLEKPVKKEKLAQALLKLSEEFLNVKNVLLYKDKEQSYSWDSHKRELFCNSDIISLTKKEKSLLELLITTHHNKVTYQQIFDVVWFDSENFQDYSESSIKTLIKKLRSKLPPDLIKNAYGLGYYLEKISY